MPKLLYSIFVIMILFSTHVFASPLDENMAKKIFNEWTFAFNHKKLEKTCDLFSSQVIASYQGVPTKNYHAICDGFKKIFQQTAFRYEYKYSLRQMYSSDTLAAIRIVWYLNVFKNGKLISSSRDEGLDVFQFENAQWRIVNYLGYPASGRR